MSLVDQVWDFTCTCTAPAGERGRWFQAQDSQLRHRPRPQRVGVPSAGVRVYVRALMIIISATFWHATIARTHRIGYPADCLCSEKHRDASRKASDQGVANPTRPLEFAK
jgi:hypothetical protein